MIIGLKKRDDRIIIYRILGRMQFFVFLFFGHFFSHLVFYLFAPLDLVYCTSSIGTLQVRMILMILQCNDNLGATLQYSDEDIVSKRSASY